MKENNLKKIIIFFIFTMSLFTMAYAQKPNRIGTTAASFLEMGFGGKAIGMGDAVVADVRDVSSVYWNPAGLGYMRGMELQVMYQPWFVGINTAMVNFGYVHPTIGTFGVGLFMINYGEEDVTSLDLPDGTGEKFDGAELSLNLDYGRKLADWFSFGIGFKYINSHIWHENASAFAMDLGAIVNTKFLAWSDTPGDGLNIGMSISNYGTKLTYDGIDLKQSVDILPDENGNFAYVPVRYELDGWELPLIFRLGVQFYPLVLQNQRVSLSIDALHPNNNSESVNIGGEYSYNLPGYGSFNIRAGYKGLFLSDSQGGLTFGFGVSTNFLDNQVIKIDYAFRKLNVLGYVHSYTIGLSF